MADPVAALPGATFDGIARIETPEPQGMITLRGDLDDAGFGRAVRAATGLAVPERMGTQASGSDAILWMSPDEVLVLCPYPELSGRLAALQSELDGQFAMAVDVSDARAVFDLSGDCARDVLAKLSPVDVSPDAFAPGMVRRTRLSQVAAAFWLREDGVFRIVCFRSVAQYVFDILKLAAQPGSDVGAM